jgi:hypothetical protein
MRNNIIERSREGCAQAIPSQAKIVASVQCISLDNGVQGTRMASETRDSVWKSSLRVQSRPSSSGVRREKNIAVTINVQSVVDEHDRFSSVNRVKHGIPSLPKIGRSKNAGDVTWPDNEPGGSEKQDITDLKNVGNADLFY